MADILAAGGLKKMQATAETPINYSLPIGEEYLPLNSLIGKKLTLSFSGSINCIACGRKTNKSFNQGHCYPCFKKLASCDICMVSPEKCHFDNGTCREPDWAQDFCMTDHIVYLANSSGLKVGITRINQIPTRWLDQGARQALPIFRVKTRMQSGLVEDCLKQFVADKTNWRALLKGDADIIDMVAARDKLLEEAKEALAPLVDQYGVEQIQPIVDVEVSQFDYPVEKYPEKIKSFNFDKTPEVSGVLQGIKGQYLIFDTGVINIRKFTAYSIEVGHE
ncbi:MAG: DUF2797 domain-containing protein [Cellvibrionaceae bacterium]